MCAALVHQPPALFQIMANGIDASDKFNRYLIKLSVVIVGDAGWDDKAEIILDDTGGQLAIPPQGGPVEIGLGWQDTGPMSVFSGWVDESIASEPLARATSKCNVQRHIVNKRIEDNPQQAGR